MGNGVAYGGVAVFFKEEKCRLKPVNLVDNPDDFEILSAIGTLQGHTRKVVIIACYIPPNYNMTRGTGCLDYIQSLVIEAKRRYKDPYVIISGDFNQWDLGYVMEEFRDIKETVAGPTRGSRRIDRTFSNLDRVQDKGILNPLQGRSGLSTWKYQFSYYH